MHELVSPAPVPPDPPTAPYSLLLATTTELTTCPCGCTTTHDSNLCLNRAVVMSTSGYRHVPTGNSGQYLAEFGEYTEGAGAPGAPGRQKMEA